MRRALFLPVAAVLVVVTTGAVQDATQADARRMESKLTAIAKRGALPAGKRTPLQTSFTDREVNAYFKVNGRELLPQGLTDPQIGIGDGGKVTAKAIVDLDTALKANERSWLLSLLGGKVEITAAGLVTGHNGLGTLQLEHATLGGVPVPTSLLQQLVTYYTRTPENPSGFDLTKPFPLPANIQALESRRGTATVTQ